MNYFFLIGKYLCMCHTHAISLLNCQIKSTSLHQPKKKKKNTSRARKNDPKILIEKYYFVVHFHTDSCFKIKYIPFPLPTVYLTQNLSVLTFSNSLTRTRTTRLKKDVKMLSFFFFFFFNLYKAFSSFYTTLKLCLVAILKQENRY